MRPRRERERRTEGGKVRGWGTRSALGVGGHPRGAGFTAPVGIGVPGRLLGPLVPGVGANIVGTAASLQALAERRSDGDVAAVLGANTRVGHATGVLGAGRLTGILFLALALVRRLAPRLGGPRQATTARSVATTGGTLAQHSMGDLGTLDVPFDATAFAFAFVPTAALGALGSGPSGKCATPGLVSAAGDAASQDALGTPATPLVTGGRLLVFHTVLFHTGVNGAARQGTAAGPIHVNFFGALDALIQEGVSAAGAPDAAAIAFVLGRTKAAGNRAALGNLGQLRTGTGGTAVVAQIGAFGAAFGLGTNGLGAHRGRLGTTGVVFFIVHASAPGDGTALGNLGQLYAGTGSAAVIGQIGAGPLRADGSGIGAASGVVFSVSPLGANADRSVIFQADPRGAFDETAVLTRRSGNADAASTVLVASVGIDTLVQLTGAGGNAFGAQLVLHLGQGQGIRRGAHFVHLALVLTARGGQDCDGEDEEKLGSSKSCSHRIFTHCWWLTTQNSAVGMPGGVDDLRGAARWRHAV